MSEQLTKEQKARVRRVRIRQIGGDDGFQWNLIIDGTSRMNGMDRREAEHRRKVFIATGDIWGRPSSNVSDRAQLVEIVG